ncbi:MAG: hypothetical protein KAR57_06230 [Bacteroidales bacterium]|nr:hypothetical protein [Bacteroidales bacterium]
MLPEENKTQDATMQNPEPVEPVPIETPDKPSADFTNPEHVEQPQETVIPADEEVIEQTVSEFAPITQDSVSEQSPQTPEPQQPQIQEKIIYRTDPNIVQKLLVKARAKIQERKRKKLDRVMALFEALPQITNKDIQKLLRISSATAVRYLDILEAENRIKQVGNTGKSVFYTKV